MCVNHLEIEGNSTINSEAIKALSGISSGMNMLKINRQKVESALSQNPYLKLVDIERRFPDTVVLHVYEREERAVVEYLGAYIGVDENGTVLRTIVQPDPEALVVSGMDVKGVASGEILQSEDKQKVESLCALLQYLVASERLDSVGAIQLEDTQNAALSLRSGYTLKLGQVEELETKFIWVDTMLPVLAEKGLKTGTLNVTSSKNATYSP